LKFTAAVRVPVAVGANTTLTVQLAPAASVELHVLLKTAKSPGLAPPKVMLLMVIGVVFPFVSVAIFCPLRLPMATDAHEMLAGDTDALPVVPTPVPDSVTTCGLLLAVFVDVRVAVRAPGALGLNTTIMEQLDEAARLAKQDEPEMEKSAALGPVIATLLSVMDAPGPFDNVADCDALPVPTEVLGKERLVGETDALLEAANPVPVSATVCGLLVAESVNPRVAARVPSPVGLNTTAAEQLAEAARLVPQVVAATANSAAFVPVMVMLLIVTGVLSPLASVTDFEPLLDPSAMPSKERLVGLTATALGAVPRPVRATVCGLPTSESLKFSVAVRVPMAVGPNTIFTVQLVPAASVEPQVLLKTVSFPQGCVTPGSLHCYVQSSAEVDEIER
jgi:hypothetical protein